MRSDYTDGHTIATRDEERSGVLEALRRKCTTQLAYSEFLREGVVICQREKVQTHFESGGGWEGRD